MKNVFNLDDYEQTRRFEEESFIGPIAIWTKRGKKGKLEKIYVNWAILYKTYAEREVRPTQEFSKRIR